MHDEQWVSGSPIVNAWEQVYFSTGQVMAVPPITIVLRAVTEIVTLHTVDMGVAQVTGSRRSRSCFMDDSSPLPQIIILHVIIFEFSFFVMPNYTRNVTELLRHA